MKRYTNRTPEGRLDMPDGDYILFTNHEEEVAKLNNIIIHLEAQLKVEREENKELRLIISGKTFY